MLSIWLQQAWICLLAMEIGIAAAKGFSNDSLLWGPYRSNLYFGVRPRIPSGLLTGLMWVRVDETRYIQQSFRYTCEQHDGMAGYGWSEYDPRIGGTQTIHDEANGIDLTTQFAKSSGGEHGGNWGARIKGKVRDNSPKDLKTTVLFHVSLAGTGLLQASNEFNEHGYEEPVELVGKTVELGDFRIQVTNGPSSNQHPHSEHPSYNDKPLDKTFVGSMQLPDDGLWQGKVVAVQEFSRSVDEYLKDYGEDNTPPAWQLFTIANGELLPGNFHLVQKVFEGDFEFDILFTSASSPSPMTSKSLSAQIKENEDSFNLHIDKVFPAQAPYDKSRYREFKKSMFSNLVGGIGYFHGDSVVDRSYAPEYEEDNEGFWMEAEEARARNRATREGPYELFTAVPSRPFFPRGFLWDEGFHLLPIMDFDMDLSLDIIQSWLHLMDQDGWIAREQILGAEARSKVPPEFQVQYPHYANPPTLFLAIESLLDKISAKTFPDSTEKQYISWLTKVYPLLQRHYLWYRKTQVGDMKSFDRPSGASKEGYRWRGRTPKHILTSGLDDYPRAQPPHPGELHVDLLSWMGLLARSMKRIARFVGENDDAEDFAKQEQGITKNLEVLHWDESAQAFCDSTIDEYEEHVRVCHKGYISLFPFMTGMLSGDNEHLGAVLDLIEDPTELWSDHGIRSLSKKNELYGTDENYWRSPVWMNLNYLVLINLRKIAEAKGAHQKQAGKLYSELRVNLVNTVMKSWQKTGFAWEQYNPETGEGQRTQHFTGWTSLVVKIMCMPNLSDGLVEGHGEL